MGPAGGPATHERDVRCLGPVGAGLCIGMRRHAVAETAPTAGPMSKSDTKGFQRTGRMNENLGIMRLRIGSMRAIRAFVTDLDILARDRLR